MGGRSTSWFTVAQQKALMKERSKKLLAKWKIWLPLFVGCACLTAFLLFKFVDQLPERELARDFLLGNTKVREYFGTLKEVSYDAENAAKVSFGRRRREGIYPFKIKGTKNSGVIRVSWHSEGSGINFTVDMLELLEPWKNPVVIWSRKKHK